MGNIEMNTCIDESGGPFCDTAILSSDSFKLSQWEIRRLLPAYREDSIFLREAMLWHNRFEGVFSTFRHPFTERNPKHLTREHALVFITQASYVFASHLCESHPYWGISAKAFHDLAIEEQATFTHIEMRFKRFIRNHDGIELLMHCTRERVLDKRVFLTFAFEFPAGCSGVCEGFISSDSSLCIGDSI